MCPLITWTSELNKCDDIADADEAVMLAVWVGMVRICTLFGLVAEESGGGGETFSSRNRDCGGSRWVGVPGGRDSKGEDMETGHKEGLTGALRLLKAEKGKPW